MSRVLLFKIRIRCQDKFVSNEIFCNGFSLKTDDCGPFQINQTLGVKSEM